MLGVGVAAGLASDGFASDAATGLPAVGTAEGVAAGSSRATGTGPSSGSLVNDHPVTLAAARPPVAITAITIRRATELVGAECWPKGTTVLDRGQKLTPGNACDTIRSHRAIGNICDKSPIWVFVWLISQLTGA
ncbi:hypothetical protein Aph01nite_68820 [Acrocarpospora phusangensis]|uniref:Uncharacterized protein n=1 Tax=Acrocarpospora phusangensis TaxID=1070424 RepID=A0A919QLX1_9ACTN|nr:hypothetical protein Aph01nite_68820 [Acrocarpospora phusangensis]